MTAAEQLRQAGREQGAHKKAQEIALNLLKEGAEPKFVAKITQLSPAEIKQLQTKSEK